MPAVETLLFLHSRFAHMIKKTLVNSEEFNATEVSYFKTKLNQLTHSLKFLSGGTKIEVYNIVVNSGVKYFGRTKKFAEYLMRHEVDGTLAAMFLPRALEMSDLFMLKWIAFSASKAHRIVFDCDFPQFYCETAKFKLCTNYWSHKRLMYGSYGRAIMGSQTGGLFFLRSGKRSIFCCSFEPLK